jgi:hypothetical protein
MSSNNFRINAFGTPNAMTPNTIQNSSNKNGYVQNFGRNIIDPAQPPSLTSYLIVNGNPNSTPAPTLAMEGQFVVPVSGFMKKIVVNVEAISASTSEFVSVYNSSAPTNPYDCIPSAVTNQFPVNIPLSVGDILTVTSNYSSGKTFVTLYIE